MKRLARGLTPTEGACHRQPLEVFVSEEIRTQDVAERD